MRKLLCIYVLSFVTLIGCAQKKAKQDTTVYSAVEIQPSFPGGKAAFSKFLMDHIHVSEKDKEDAATNSCLYFQFIVEANGDLANFKFIKGSKSVFDELVAHLKKGPKWSPGYLNKKKVRVQYVVPINCIMFSE
jgi:protein TonB